MDYDAIIVGARCAGAPTATVLARQGHRVLLVDRASFPSDTSSTHYIHQAGLLRLQEWGVLDRVIKAGTPAIRHMEYRNEGMNLYGFADAECGLDAVYNPRRDLLDNLLVEAATEAGVELLLGFTVTGLERDAEGAVTGITGATLGGHRHTVTAPMVIGADGTYSTIARLVGARTYNVRPASGFTYWNYYRGLDWSSAHHKTGFNRRWFGAWPTSSDTTMVAVILTNDQLQWFAEEPEQRFVSVIEELEPEMAVQLRDMGEPEGRIRRMRYAENFYREGSGPGWALVGDAGYHKDPITGWGMSDAFLQAEMLAGAVHEGLSGSRPMIEATAEFVASRDAATAAMYDYTTTVAEMSLPPFFRAVMKACSRSDVWTTKMLGIVAGVVDGDEIFSEAGLTALYEETGLPEAERVWDPAAV